MDVRCMQSIMREKYYQRDSARGLYKTFAWLVEEVGELGRALLNSDSIGMKEELADVFAWVISIANLVDIDVENALKNKYVFLKNNGCEGS